MTFSRIKQLLASFAEPDPRRDWFVALIALVLLFLAFWAYAAFLFFSILSGTVFAGGGRPAPHITVTRADIQNTLATYQTRQVNYAAHNLPAPPVVDPAH